MNNQTLRNMALTYFTGVDTQDIEMIFKTLSGDCLLKIETHGVELVGRAAITGVFERLWAHHDWVRHDQFHFVDGENGSDIAVRFQVTNKMHDGSLIHKSNCNFFTAKDGLFTEVRVYMTGENTLDAKK